MIVLAALATLALLTTSTVRGGEASETTEHANAVALRAAESGAATAMDYLRANLDPVRYWSAYVTPNNATLIKPPVPGNDVLPGRNGNPFSADQQAWYKVEVLNNRTDPGLSTGKDQDARIVIRATGHGPAGAVAVIEWEILGTSSTAPLTLIGWRQIL
jgi:hypothetical protein